MPHHVQGGVVEIKAVRCYRDGLRYRSRSFHGYPRHLTLDHDDIRLGRVIFRVRETLAVKDTGDPYNAPALIDEAATFLPVGTPVYEVIGYPAEHRLAAYLNDELHIYDLDERER
jgi:hypothetical protein